jgi:tetratricopeptide (TPR) repeat protein
MNDKAKERSKWQVLLDFINAIPKLVLLLALIFLAGVVYFEMMGNAVLIEPFEVPIDLEKKGYTSKAIANKLLDQVDMIRTKATTRMERRRFSPLWYQSLPSISVPGAGISVQSIVRYMREFFGQESIRIVGEVVSESNELCLTIRIRGKPAKEICKEPEELNSILRTAAEHIYLHTQPFILASFLYVSDIEADKGACVETIKYILANEPADDDLWALTLWGVLLHQQNRSEEAIEKYRQAVSYRMKEDKDKLMTAEVKSLAAYNWGHVLYAQKDYQGACVKYKKATVFDPRNVEAYISWGNSEALQEHYERANARFQKAAGLEPRNAMIYFYWARILSAQGDSTEARAKFDQAIKLDPRIGFTHFVMNQNIVKQPPLKLCP